MTKMHADELDLDVDVARRLVAAQFPQWRLLPVARVPSAGTDNAIFRLGDELVLRLPREPSAAPRLEKELEWLPRLAPHLPVAIPSPVAVGAPGDGYPWRFAVYRWLEGESASTTRIGDMQALAHDLAAFVLALRSIDARDGPPPGEHNAYRGVPLRERDRPVRRALALLQDEIDVPAATAAWDAALAIPEWAGAQQWLHGDLLAGNVLLRDGSLHAVIDFGCLGVGDPACDLQPAWTLLAAARDTYRGALDVDDDAWARGRGWALSWALIALPYYLETNPAICAAARSAIAEVLAEE